MGKLHRIRKAYKEGKFIRKETTKLWNGKIENIVIKLNSCEVHRSKRGERVVIPYHYGWNGYNKYIRKLAQ